MNSDVTQPASTSSSQTAAWAHLRGIPPLAAPALNVPIPESDTFEIKTTELRPSTTHAGPDRRPRRMSEEARSIDNVLSHAIEYLTDARQLPSGRITELSPDEPDVQAILVLMEARHQNYLDCPVIDRRTGGGLFGLFKGIERRKGIDRRR